MGTADVGGRFRWIATALLGAIAAGGAVDLAPQRIDYLVEYGAVLQCYASRRDEVWASGEAARVLGRAIRSEPHIGTDALDQEHAKTLLREPGKSCGYSRDGWIDTSRRAAARAG